MYTLRIALRYLFARKSHNAVNIISIVSLIGVAVATAAIVCVLSVFNGFALITSERLSYVDPDIRVSPAHGKVIDNADSLALAIATNSQVTGAAAAISEQAMAFYCHRQMPVRLMGLPPEAASIVRIDTLIIDGSMLADHPEMPFAQLSVGVAARLGAYAESEYPLTLLVPRRKGRISTTAPLSSFTADTLAISGVYEARQTDIDSETLVTSLATARRLLNYTTQASSIEIALRPDVNPDRFASQLASQLGPNYIVRTRAQLQEGSFRMIAIEKWITFAMLAFILIIASFNVVSTLSMIIIEKRANMATLRALGAPQSAVGRIFMLEGMLITTAGGMVGIVVGVLLSLIQQYGGVIKLAADPEKLTVTTYPVELQWPDIAAVLGLVVLTSTIIGLIASALARRNN